MGYSPEGAVDRLFAQSDYDFRNQLPLGIVDFLEARKGIKIVFDTHSATGMAVNGRPEEGARLSQRHIRIALRGSSVEVVFPGWLLALYDRDGRELVHTEGRLVEKIYDMSDAYWCKSNREQPVPGPEPLYYRAKFLDVGTQHSVPGGPPSPLEDPYYLVQNSPISFWMVRADKFDRDFDILKDDGELY